MFAGFIQYPNLQLQWLIESPYLMIDGATSKPNILCVIYVHLYSYREGHTKKRDKM